MSRGSGNFELLVQPIVLIIMLYNNTYKHTWYIRTDNSTHTSDCATHSIQMKNNFIKTKTNGKKSTNRNVKRRKQLAPAATGWPGG